MLEFATIAISAKFMNIPVLALAPVALLGFRWWVIYRFYDGRRGLSPTENPTCPIAASHL